MGTLPYSLGADWGKIWSYRRVLNNGGTITDPKPGEISNQNWGSGNDYKGSYLLLSSAETVAQIESWNGGLNIYSLRKAEERSYGWYWYYRISSPTNFRNNITLDIDTPGTFTGLSKIPYIRDTRRSIGNGNFLLTKMDMTGNLTSSYGFNFTDSISLGNYNAADVHGMIGCIYPTYVNKYQILPYTIPFRALTNRDFDNLLVAGKTMAQTFMANAATRLHPIEWSTGLSAGLAASMMKRKHLSTSAISENITELQKEIQQYMPIFWPNEQH